MQKFNPSKSYAIGRNEPNHYQREVFRMADSESFVTPCPFSRGYHIPSTQAWRWLSVFSLYRFMLAGAFALLFFLGTGPSLLGQHDPSLYAISSCVYLGLACGSAVLLFSRRPGYGFQVLMQMVIDLIVLTLLMYSSGGIESGIGTLMAVSVAAGGLLAGSRCALFFAALASLAVLVEQVYADLYHAFPTTAYTYSGMLGASFFTIALLAHVLARRAERNEAIAEQRTAELANLQQINEYIIEHLQSGVIVLDRSRHIVMMNASARRLFRLASTPASLAALSPQLLRHYRRWISDGGNEPAVLRTTEDASVHVRFSQFSETDETFRMIVLEDSTLINQRVQQSKLASLGRLTASIAHEIRNPLGAISHAGQLLAESADLSQQDLRLTEIIRDHTKRVNRTIENVLQISRRTPAQQAKIALKPWLEDFIKTFQKEQRLVECPFDCDLQADDMLVLMDAGHLNQILNNLSTNALKHSRGEGARIQIKARYYQHSPCIEVIDNGPGISDNDAPRIFEPFFTTSSSGTGLGLFIAKEMAELNQAKLNYEPLSEGGSCFRLCLPDAKETMIEI